MFDETVNMLLGLCGGAFMITLQSKVCARAIVTYIDDQA